MEGHQGLDPIPMRISIPSQYVVSQGVGYRKGKSAIHRARTYVGRKENVTGQRFWARGYFVSTVGADEEAIREPIRRQEQEDRRLDQIKTPALPEVMTGIDIVRPRGWIIFFRLR